MTTRQTPSADIDHVVKKAKPKNSNGPDSAARLFKRLHVYAVSHSNKPPVCFLQETLNVTRLEPQKCTIIVIHFSYLPETNVFGVFRGKHTRQAKREHAISTTKGS